MDKQTAFEIAQAYIYQYGVPVFIEVHNVLEHEYGYAFFMEHSNVKVIVDVESKSVAYLEDEIGEWWFPHEFVNSMTREEAENIVQHYIENEDIVHTIQKGKGCFYESGVDYYKIKEPVWCVSAWTRSYIFGIIDGASMCHYFVSMRNKEVVRIEVM